MESVSWDPDQYERYADERGRPFRDLLARVGATAPRSVVDLGCGPGTLTRSLLDRWPGARVRGLDLSEAMIARARSIAVPGRLDFAVGDLRTWRPAQPVDVLVSNATLHWVPDHLDRLASLTAAVAPGGWLAFQVPANAAEPAHRLLDELRGEPPWRARLGTVARPTVEEPRRYLGRLADLGWAPDVWETTYLHVLPGPDSVLHWMIGAALRPIISALGGVDGDAFLAEYGGRLRVAYPASASGTVLAYRRIFVVAQRQSG